MGSLDGKEKIRKKRRHDSGNVQIPKGVACRPTSGMIEAGVLLSLATIVLYLFGFYEVVLALPDNPPTPNWIAHIGENLNLAVDEWSSVASAAKNVHLDGAKAGVEKADALQFEEDGKTVELPATKWPVSLRDEPDNVEKLIHTGDNKTVMTVPKFWSKPVHQNKLMSRDLALKIGSCAEPDSSGNYARGDSCPTDQRTIYVGIASYRDFECRSTVESIFLRAAHPERVRVGVVDQITGDDPVCNEPIKPCTEDPNQALCKYASQVDVYKMEASLSIGPVFARHIGYRMYRGEYYATQSDAHVTYTLSWDKDIIDQIEATNNEMAVLTTYLTDIQGSIDKNGHSLRNTRPIMCNTIYEGGPQGMHLRHGSQPEKYPSIQGVSMLQPWWAAGYSFSRGHFVVNVPYDPYQPMIFQGEEMSIGIRGFTIGYDYYAPGRSVCFHHYAVGKNKKLRNKVHHFWENDAYYMGTGKKAMARLLGIVHMNPEIDPAKWDHVEEDTYGIGKVRTCEKFYDLFGINVVKKTIEGHLCSFVAGGKMHKQFHDLHLRKDGMGIDYSDVNYHFKDPRPGQD